MIKKQMLLWVLCFSLLLIQLLRLLPRRHFPEMAG